MWKLVPGLAFVYRYFTSLLLYYLTLDYSSGLEGALYRFVAMASKGVTGFWYGGAFIDISVKHDNCLITRLCNL